MGSGFWLDDLNGIEITFDRLGLKSFMGVSAMYVFYALQIRL